MLGENGLEAAEASWWWNWYILSPAQKARHGWWVDRATVFFPLGASISSLAHRGSFPRDQGAHAPPDSWLCARGRDRLYSNQQSVAHIEKKSRNTAAKHRSEIARILHRLSSGAKISHSPQPNTLKSHFMDMSRAVGREAKD